MKVLFGAGRMTELGWAKEIFPTKRLEELQKVAEVEVTHATDEQTIKEKAKGADIIIAAATPISAGVIYAAKNLKMIQVPSIGYDHVDAVAASTNGVVICNVGESCANSVAELCFAFILDLARRVSLHDRDMRAGGWANPRRLETDQIVEIRYKTLGIIGLGTIGIRMAQIGKYGFNMRVLASDPFITGDRADLYGAELVDLTTLLKESDVVTVHVPLTPGTRHLISEKELGLMKPNAIFINAARGPVVDEQALIKILHEKRINSAGLDVFEIEPLPKDSPLRKLDNVVIVPHIGGTPSTLKHMYDIAVANVIRVAKGEQPMMIQNIKTYYTSSKWAK
jgi:D-3-phosphoglycerate dehydrogenase